MSQLPEDLPHAPATLRNREPIRDVLAPRLPSRGLVLEIASGTGEHAVYLAGALAGLIWQPTDGDPANLPGLGARVAAAGLPNLRPPQLLDAARQPWPVADCAAIFCANMTHIALMAATLGLLAGAARVLGPGGHLFLYGPYRFEGRHTAPSNEAFDASLRSRNPSWGVRDAETVAEAGRAEGLALVETIAMPANNFILAFVAGG